MVLKRLSNIIVLLFISFLLYAHPFIDGIEGYRVSPIALKGTDNFYLKNEICKANGIKIQTIYQFDFEEENIRVDARLTFTGSGATGSFQQTFPIPKDLNICINGEKISYEIIYDGKVITFDNNDFFDKRLSGKVVFSFLSKKDTVIEISYSNNNIYSIQKYHNNTWKKEFSYDDFKCIAKRDGEEPCKIKLQIYNFGFDEESYFYYPIIRTKLIKQQDLFFLSNKQLRLLRNAFYAIHGYDFKSQDLKEYFSGFSCYKPNPNFSESDFTEIERKNIELIRWMERQKEPIILDGPR